MVYRSCSFAQFSQFFFRVLTFLLGRVDCNSIVKVLNTMHLFFFLHKYRHAVAINISLNLSSCFLSCGSGWCFRFKDYVRFLIFSSHVPLFICHFLDAIFVLRSFFLADGATVQGRY